MPYTPTDPPLLADEQANELGKWIRDELTRISKAFDAPSVSQYEVLHAEPAKPREGMIIVADGTDWDPGEGEGQYMYIGGAWVFQRSGPEPNSYGIMTDGTTASPAEVANDTFKFRGEGITPVTQNDDVTHGDNVNMRLTPTTLTSAAPALGDAVPFGDVSDSNNPKKMTPQTLLDLIGSLATEASPDLAADFAAIYDASGAVAVKTLLSKINGRKLISTTALTSGSSTNITVPSGYKDMVLLLKSVSTNGTNRINVRFSEDAGSTFVSYAYNVFSNGSVVSSNSVDDGNVMPADSSNTFENMWRCKIHDYASSADKFTEEIGSRGPEGVSNSTWVGTRSLNSAAAINLINLNVTGGGAFDGSGSAELWGYY